MHKRHTTMCLQKREKIYKKVYTIIIYTVNKAPMVVVSTLKKKKT